MESTPAHTPTRGTQVIPLGAKGSRIEVLLPGSATDGLISVLRWQLSTTSRGPSAHFHTTFAETFLVESGSLDVLVGEQWRTLHAGDIAHAARGEVHALHKNNDDPACVVMVLTPGVPREEYFAALSQCRPEDEEDLHRRFDNHDVSGTQPAGVAELP